MRVTYARNDWTAVSRRSLSASLNASMLRHAMLTATVSAAGRMFVLPVVMFKRLPKRLASPCKGATSECSGAHNDNSIFRLKNNI